MELAGFLKRYTEKVVFIKIDGTNVKLVICLAQEFMLFQSIFQDWDNKLYKGYLKCQVFRSNDV
jgi:hypothetical protein